MAKRGKLVKRLGLKSAFSVAVFFTLPAAAQTTCLEANCDSNDIEQQIQQMISSSLSFTDDPAERQQCYDQCGALFVMRYNASEVALAQPFDPDRYSMNGQTMAELCQSIAWQDLNECINPFAASNCNDDGP